MCSRIVSQNGAVPPGAPLAAIEPRFAVLEVGAAGIMALAAGNDFDPLGSVTERLVGRPAREALEGAPDLERLVARAFEGRPVDVAAVASCGPTRAARIQVLFGQVPAAVGSPDRDLRFTPGRLEIPAEVRAGRSSVWTKDGTSLMGVPLLGRGAVLGEMVFRVERGHRYDDEDVGLVEELARRSALAIENAGLYREALRVREEFLSIAAHEIRTPTTTIHLAVPGLQGKELSGEVAGKLLAAIEREDRRLAQLVELVQIARNVCERLATERTRSGSAITLDSDAQVVGTWDRSLGGTVRVRSSPGRGAEFTVELPMEVRR
jgi:signal transduction histidine kinase